MTIVRVNPLSELWKCPSCGSMNSAPWVALPLDDQEGE